MPESLKRKLKKASSADDIIEIVGELIDRVEDNTDSIEDIKKVVEKGATEKNGKEETTKKSFWD